MRNLLYEYNLDLTTWVYLSSLLALTVFFKFSPLFRVRNLDMLALVAMSPALVMLQTQTAYTAGCIWLFVMGLLLFARLLLDPLMVRRPLLEANLNTGGMTFLGLSILVFLCMHIGSSAPRWEDPPAAVATLEAPPQVTNGATFMAAPPPPANALAPAALHTTLHASPPSLANPLLVWADEPPQTTAIANATDWTRDQRMAADIVGRILAALAQIAIVGGLITGAALHFNNVVTGISIATLYLVLPSTALSVDRLDQTLPTALIIWALVFYRYPMLAGLFIGAAAGATFYPIFLLPLWCGFYGQRGLLRFLSGCGIAMVSWLLVTVVFVGWVPLGQQIVLAFGWQLPAQAASTGLWGPVFDPVYRLPMQVAFGVLCGSFILWPVDKNLGTLLSCSATLMLATQFWHPQGGVYLGWYLPLVLMTVFRPNLQDRMAVVVLDKGWLSNRTRHQPQQAA